MPIVRSRSEALEIYGWAAERRWVLPSFGTENLTTTEAILAAASERAGELGVADLPVTVAITHRYPERSQSSFYSHTGNPDLGMRLFHADLRELVAKGSPFERLRVLVHLDHGQSDLDADILEDPSPWFSSVMFDASGLPFEENIAATAEYVGKHGADIVIEGACDSIAHAGESGLAACTSADQAERFFRATNVDWIVANLGTEHRAGVSELRYHDHLAREISRRTGPRLCLHGASSVEPSALASLFEDGVRKVNLWTALERDSSSDLLRHLVENAGAVAGTAACRQMQRENLLGLKADVETGASIEFCTTAHRQQVVFQSMKAAVLNHLRRWYPA
jgi:fructose-bisphosphate aldolase class II